MGSNPSSCSNAQVVELVYTTVLETVAERHEGSSPSLGTNAEVAELENAAFKGSLVNIIVFRGQNS